MSRVLRRLTTTDVDTAVPMAGPAKALTVGTRASGETSKASLAELKEPTQILWSNAPVIDEVYDGRQVLQVEGETCDEATLRWAIASDPNSKPTNRMRARMEEVGTS
jgi:hypothetical protein